MQCCSEEMSSVVKTVKDHEATKTPPQWTANMFKAQTQPVLLNNLNYRKLFLLIHKKGKATYGLILSYIQIVL
jgi:hypothetical protein